MASPTPNSLDNSPGAGGTNAQGLSDWAAPYITDYLGKAKALAGTDYQTYKGPLTAGTSDLQNQAFQGISSLTVPGAIGDAATAAGKVGANLSGMSYAPTTFGNQYKAPDAYQSSNFTNQYQAPDAYKSVGSTFDSTQAQQYMNPYLQASLNPQLEEARRQSQMTQMQNAAKMSSAGGFGGSRQAIMDAETQRNLGTNLANITGQGYNTAFGQAQQQFNTDQQRKIQEAQFGAQQGMTAAQLQAQFGLSADQANEMSRQFGAQQKMTASQLAAQFGLSGEQATEASKQFGTNFGLNAQNAALSAAQAQGNLGALQNQTNLANLNAQLAGGATQRGIEQEGTAADLAEFEKQRQFPYQQLQFQRDMISGLPTSAVSNTPAQMSDIGNLLSTLGGATKVAEALGYKNVNDLLKKLGLDLGP
jgi:hypothetical protein